MEELRRVVRPMHQEQLQARVGKRFRCTTISEHDHLVAANLLDRQFTWPRPRISAGSPYEC